MVSNLGIRTPTRERRTNVRGQEMINSLGKEKSHISATQNYVYLFILYSNEGV